MAALNRPMLALTIVSCLLGLSVKTQAAQYLGKFLGKLTELHHGVSGEVYAVDARTLHIKDFMYDGQGPAAYFFAGNSRAPGNTGFRIRDENGSGDVLRRYRKEGVTITLPEGKSLNSIKWFSVWCEEFEVNFGDVKIPRNFDYPRPQKVEALRGVHGVSSDNIVIVDAQTLLVPNLSYDGEAPDAKFWVGSGSKPSPQGIRVPDENGKEIPLRKYDRKTVVLTLPGDLTVFDIGHFGIWCEAFTVDFGHVQIPQTVNVPPSLKMLGVSPQSKLNCEVLQDDLAFEVRWAVAGDSIVLQLVAKLENREYMSFGISGDTKNSVMVGGDVVVAWVDKETLKGYAEDYYLDAKSQCSGPKGSCPDNKLAENTNNIRLLNAAMVNGYSIVTYQRPLKPSDEFDRQILTNKTQPIIWAIGPLNQRNEVSFHSQYNKHNQLIDFGRPAKWNCPMPEGDQPSMKPVTARPVIKAVVEDKIEEEAETPKPVPTRSRNNERRRGGSAASRQEVKEAKDSEKSATRTRVTERRGSERKGARPVPTPAPVKNRNAWDIPAIQCHEPDDGVFYAQMGPTGGKRGYPAITGHVGWGISWYINGLLIPEINVVRGKTYTFVVEGGFDSEIPAKYHPFYITDDAIGGYEYKTNEEKQNVRIFAGARQSKDGNVHPTGVGRLCHWTHQGDSDADDFDSFGAYQRTLELKCDQGEPGVIQWTPDKDTPDTVYYQCFTHRYLGWKINVVDSCDHQGASSEIKPIIVEPDMTADLVDSPSQRIETRVKANDIELVVDKDENEGDIIDKQSYQVEESDEEPNGETEIVYNQELPKLEQEQAFKTLDEIQKESLPFMQHRPAPGRLVIRRPVTNQVRPPFMAKPYMRPSHMHRMPQMSYKKSYYRPIVKMPIRTRNRHHMMKYESKSAMQQPMQSRPQNVYLKPNMYNKPKIVVISAEPKFVPDYTTKYIPEYTTKLIPDYTTKFVHSSPNIMTTFIKHEPKVEISAQQHSTEREINIPTEKLALLPQIEKKYEAYDSMKPAINTGFNPASVVIESGFKPIMSKETETRIKEIESRMTDNASPEIEFESELGVIDETKPVKAQKATEFFEPMFIPSPTIDSQLKKSQIKRKKTIFVLKQSRSIHDDEQAAANERVESYYLPPDNSRSKQAPRPRQHSNIDVPPGTVVTYDGRKVSGASLTPRGEQRAFFQNRSKASDLIRSRPQFVPFKGELPPLDAQFINYNAPQLQSRGLNRQSESAQVQGATKLKLVSQVESDDEKEVGSRKRRNAHHTEEHTLEQEKEKQEKEKSKSSSNNVQITFYTIISSLLIHYVLKL